MNLCQMRCALGVSSYIRGVSDVPWGWVKFMCDGVSYHVGSYLLRRWCVPPCYVGARRYLEQVLEPYRYICFLPGPSKGCLFVSAVLRGVHGPPLEGCGMRSADGVQSCGCQASVRTSRFAEPSTGREQSRSLGRELVIYHHPWKEMNWIIGLCVMMWFLSCLSLTSMEVHC